MDDLLPVDPRARRLTLIVWSVAAVFGTAAVWWLSSYIDSLTGLLQTDRRAAVHLFRTRVLPAVVVVALVGVAAGALVVRQGHQLRRGERGHFVGTLMVVAGVILAIVPLVLVALLFWLLRAA
jgi:hypothetical protein